MNEQMKRGSNVLEHYRRKLMSQSKSMDTGLSKEVRVNKQSVTDDILNKLAERAIKNFRKRVLK